MNLPQWLHNLYRADFLRSVGLYIMRDHLVLVRMRKTFYACPWPNKRPESCHWERISRPYRN